MKPCIVWDSIMSLDKGSKGDISQIVEMTAALASQGVDVHLVALNAGQKRIPGATIHQVPALWLIRQRTRTLGRLFPRLFGHSGVCNARHVAKYVISVLDASHDFDLYHTRCRQLAIELKRLQPRKPLVYNVCPWYFHACRPRERVLDQKAIDAADRLVTFTEAWKQFTVENFDLRGKEIEVIPVCVARARKPDVPRDAVSFPFDGKKLVGYFGRLQRGYGIDTLIEIAPEVKKAVPDVHFLIAGGSVYGHRGELEGLAARLGVAEYVHFVGELPRELVPVYLENCDVLVSLRHDSSGRLGFDLSIPIKCVEYMMRGKPLVATRDGGMEQLVGEDYPYLVRNGDRGFLACCIASLLRDDSEARRVGAENAARSAPYAHEVVSQKLLALYRRAVRGSP